MDKDDSLENPFDDSQNIVDQLPSIDLNTGFEMNEEPKKPTVHALVDTPYTQIFADGNLKDSNSNPSSARGKRSKTEKVQQEKKDSKGKKPGTYTHKRVEKKYCTPLKEKLNADDMNIDDSSEDEGLPDYKIGGYHPVHVGEVMVD